MNINDMILNLLDLQSLVKEMTKALEELCELPNKKRPERIWAQAQAALENAKPWASPPLTLTFKDKNPPDDLPQDPPEKHWTR